MCVKSWLICAPTDPPHYRNMSKDVRTIALSPSQKPTRTLPDIVRILFLVPIYAIVSLASYFFWVRPVSPLSPRPSFTQTYPESLYADHSGPRLLRVHRPHVLLLPPPSLFVPRPSDPANDSREGGPFLRAREASDTKRHHGEEVGASVGMGEVEASGTCAFESS